MAHNNGGGGEYYELSPEGQGFAALRAMLLSAPLPGGRGDGYCDDSGLDDYLEEELLSEGNDEDDDNNNDEGAEDPGDIDQILIDGVAPNACLLWEALPRTLPKYAYCCRMRRRSALPARQPMP